MILIIGKIFICAFDYGISSSLCLAKLELVSALSSAGVSSTPAFLFFHVSNTSGKLSRKNMRRVSLLSSWEIIFLDS